MKAKGYIYALLRWVDRLVRWCYNLLRSLVVPLLCMAILVPLVAMVALSTSRVQRRIADTLEKELTTLLGAQVSIGDLGIVPFNRVALRNVSVVSDSDTLLTANRIGAAVSVMSLIESDRWVINSVELLGVNLNLRRDSIGAPLNIQPIIDALTPKEKKKEPTLFDLKINSIVLRSSSVSYDVASVPAPEAGRFDAMHIALSDIRADIHLPRIANNLYSASIKRMAMSERSGLTLTNLTADAMVSDSLLMLNNFAATMPDSRLALNGMSLTLDGLDSIVESLKTHGLSVAVGRNSHIAANDLAPLLPQRAATLLSGIVCYIDSVSAVGNAQHAEGHASLTLSDGTSLMLRATCHHLTDPHQRSAELQDLHLSAPQAMADRIAQALNLQLLRNLGNVTVDATAAATPRNGKADIRLATEAGTLKIAANAAKDRNDNLSLTADIATDQALAIGTLAKSPVERLDAALNLSAEHADRRDRSAHAQLMVNSLTLNGYTLQPFKVDATYTGTTNSIGLTTDISDPALTATVDAHFSPGPKQKIIDAYADVAAFEPYRLGLMHDSRQARFSGTVDVDMRGEQYYTLRGNANVERATMTLADGRSLTVNSAMVEMADDGITLSSDFVDGRLEGTYDFRTLAKVAAELAANILPAVVTQRIAAPADAAENDFTLQLTVNPTEPLAEFLRLPASVIYPATLSANIEESTLSGSLLLNAPYLRQGNKLIENTSLSFDFDGSSEVANLNIATTMPTKQGPMHLKLAARGGSNTVESSVGWNIDRAARYDGLVEAIARFNRTDHGQLLTTVDLQRSYLTFNDTTWTINPTTIRALGAETIAIDHLSAYHGDRRIDIDGTVSALASDRLILDLRDFSLDYLFETLGIDNVMLGGNASGTFYASRLLSPEPIIETPGLIVDNISYNRVVLGNAVVRSHWDGDRRAITLDADIDQPDNHSSRVDGAIFPLNDSLDITFLVDHANVSFLQPFMAAFASDVRGYGSGRARLYGNFKYIDLEGDVCADEIGLKINFTNCDYTARGDSVHFRPGIIDLSDITIRDPEGHSGKLNGQVRHKFFKQPTFDFAVTDAYNLLSYNESVKDNPRWYGRIYGNGSAFVKGEPGRVDINVDMATAPRSTFTFVLTDMEVADEFSFLTFRDKGKATAVITDTVELQRSNDLALVERLRALAAHHEEDAPSDYNISLQVRVTPEARLDLVMDPVGGDRIRAYGSGHLRLDYNANNNDLKMYGTYTLERGDYNFTLQDIIIKDFTIDPGSSIEFRGDPYSAQLDIEAAYSLNANLSDLDESFLQDKDLNRTNVPVQAVMKVKGDMQQPDISFDLRFPTLTTDIYRKVKSIISTDDMMNRQIMYLLALNRFYTPEYMSATKGNELVSVASSTISSQLRNMLGRISDNWSIAPTFRSDRGDFSDVEVDVALSSRLLNNRLLFNGNFGYRDKAMNSNQFIGDFDLEYLLDRTGKWRLKAYNRYNDQNYYLRTATTTQGVGVVLRQDFDSFFSWLRRISPNSRQ